MLTSRYICSVLDEMRNCYKTYNFSIMASLIEEVQTMANRMEAALDDKNSMEYYHDELKRLRKEKKELEKNIAELEEQQNKLAC